MLLEVILAVLLLAIGLFTVIEGLSRCIASASSVQNYHIAETLLTNKSFEFAVEKSADILPQDGTFADYPQFSWSRTFEMTDQEGLWQQVITVFWYERGQQVSDSVVQYRYLPEKTQ